MDLLADGNESFHCLICLELVHKPVVNACGHMFCFWCAHLAMNSWAESYCPLCRRPYLHFPRVCEQLHFFLLKAVPDEYRRRCIEVYAEEMKSGSLIGSPNSVFSPQFKDVTSFDLAGVALPQKSGSVGPLGVETYRNKSPIQGVDYEAQFSEAIHSHSTSSSVQLQIGSCSSGMDSERGFSQSYTQEFEESCMIGEDDGDTSWVSTSRVPASSELEIDTGSDTAEPSMEAIVAPTASSLVSVADLLCSKCDKLLYQPVVLNCGHVFCEACIINTDESTELKCHTCGSLHPGLFPHVCLELHHYLERSFSEEYKQRNHEEQQKAAKSCNLNMKSTIQVREKTCPASGHHTQQHNNIGCDGCGMYPIIGRRFRCTECKVPPGYDLCSRCYDNESNVHGRFNQQHIKEHRLEEMRSFKRDPRLYYESSLAFI